MLKQAKRQWPMFVVTLLMLPLLVYAGFLWQRPPRRFDQQILFPGIQYQRQIYDSPRPYILHLVQIDLTTPGIRALVTPGKKTPLGGETIARTTSDFLQEFDLQLAINANYFYPFRESTPWDFYPQPNDPITVIGQSISNGDVYADGKSQWTALCISPNHRATIVASGDCPSDTSQAIAGRELLIAEGQAVVQKTDNPSEKPYSRTAVAINKAGTILWLAIIDGKQPWYSEGVTLSELTQILISRGVEAALNLDGGGSATLVVQKGLKPFVLNAPSHTKWPMRERPVANHLGIYSTSHERVGHE
jgi:Phosphodiester glycosidase